MQLVEQNIPFFTAIDAASFAAKNLYNGVIGGVRQAFIFQGIYLDNVQIFHQMKTYEAYKALPAKVSNPQLHKAWMGYFFSYVIEIIYEAQEKLAKGDPSFTMAIDVGMNVLVAITSDQRGFTLCKSKVHHTQLVQGEEPSSTGNQQFSQYLRKSSSNPWQVGAFAVPQDGLPSEQMTQRHVCHYFKIL